MADMDFFLPRDDLPRMGPEDTRIESLHVEPYPDGERLLVKIQLTPFQVRPHIELTLSDAHGDEVAAASIVEPLSWQLQLTLHLRGASAGPFRLEARLFFPDGPQTEPVSTAFEVAPRP